MEIASQLNSASTEEQTNPSKSNESNNRLTTRLLNIYTTNNITTGQESILFTLQRRKKTEKRQMDKQTGKFSLPVIEGEKEIQVWYQKPNKQSSSTPIVFAMHGKNRNAEEYCNTWKELATKHNYIVVVPEFDKESFPGAKRYNQGNILNEEGKPNPEKQWTFSDIPRIFDFVKKQLKNKAEKFYIFGHSAGSQFVHRLLMFKPDLPVALAVAANAGWYTLPWRYKKRFPYGLGGTSKNSPENLSNFFSKPMVIMLGKTDNDPDDPNLEKNDEDVNEQEVHRYARGNYFFNKAKKEAEENGMEFNWLRESVPGVGHKPKLMAPHAAKIINQHLAENSR